MRKISAWFIHNPVAANLLMLFMVAAGLMSLGTIEREVLPTAEAQAASIIVLYPGAGPLEVEEAICRRIEEAVLGVEGVDRVRAIARENVGIVIVEFLDGADRQRMLDDIEAEIGRLDTLPEEAEDPVVSLLEIDNRVLTVVVSGPASRADLRRAADLVEDALLAQPEISLVRMANEPDAEIWIEVAEAELQARGLTLAEVAAAVREASLDLPGGSVRAAGGHLLVRAKGQALTAADFAALPLRVRPDGARLLVGDVAQVRESFAETDQESRFDGEPAVVLDVFRTSGQDALRMKDDVERALTTARAQLPEGIRADLSADDTRILRDRLDLMLRNGRSSIFLVLLSLAIFMRLRLAFWVTAGVPVAILGAITLMPFLGASVNLISLFAFILVLGIVVDDAIVVVENVHAHRKRGAPPLEAAILGVQEVAVPVTFSVLTTIAAFLPMMFLPGTMGQYARNIPIIVVAALAFSLLEALFVLPSHLRNLPPENGRRRGPWARFQDGVTRGLDAFIDRVYRPVLERVLRARWAAITASIALLILTVGWVGSGRIRFNFFPSVESDWVMAEIAMPVGTPPERTRAAARQFEDAAQTLREELRSDHGGPAVLHLRSSLGSQPVREIMSTMGGSAAMGPADSGGHLAEVWMELASAEERSIPATEIARRWQAAAGPVSGAVEVTVVADLMASDGDLNLQLRGAELEDLARAAEELRAYVAAQPGVTSARTSHRAGKPELRLELTREGEALGFTLSDLAWQARQTLFGFEVQEYQRGRDTVEVRVLFPAAARSLRSTLETMRLRAPNGSEVPFALAARVIESPGAAAIERQDRHRIVSVLATIDKSTTTADGLSRGLAQGMLPELARRYPGLTWSWEGQQREQREFLGSLLRILVIALLAIYVLLAIPLGSYLQPLVIMSAIPFGLVGAVAGHWVMGLDLTMFSLIGIIALSGIAVNDSLVMMDFVNRGRAEGASLATAVREAGPRRFLPVILTTLTTAVGLAPLVFERSLQAQFLIPMAVSVAFGVTFATFITLLLVPALLLAQADLIAAGRRFLSWGQQGAQE
jgi:multidrug efflux pump subunit AcrB